LKIVRASYFKCPEIARGMDIIVPYYYVLASRISTTSGSMSNYHAEIKEVVRPVVLAILVTASEIPVDFIVLYDYIAATFQVNGIFTEMIKHIARNKESSRRANIRRL